MPRAKCLTGEEKAKIDAFFECGLTHRAIGAKIDRSQKVVSSYLKNPDLYNRKKKRGVTSKLSPADKRRICRAASNSTRSSTQIRRDLELLVTPRRVRQVINEQEHLQSARMRCAPTLKPSHIDARLIFAKENMTRRWKTVGLL